MINKKRLPLWGILLICISLTAILSSAAALAITTFTPIKISFFNGSTVSTDFTATWAPHFSGHNKMTITVTVTNAGAVAHSGTVTVSLLDAVGNPIVISGTEQTSSQSVTDLAASGSITLKFVFTATGIVSAFQSADVQIEQQ